MSLMAGNLKKWRDAASLLLVAKQSFLPNTKSTNTINYKLLTLKRSTRSSFMPGTHVFPGGVIDKADSSQDWLTLFKKFGFNEKSFDILSDVKHKAPIFQSTDNNDIPKQISLRISAIRETFEECGVLLCKRPQKTETHSEWASFIGGAHIYEWQKRVHDDPKQFIKLCQNFEVYPDIWALHEWSNWLTPCCMDRRFDTIFFLAVLQNIPPTFAEKNEVQLISWKTPSEYLKTYKNGEIFLPPPQVYELSRLQNFNKIEDIASFSSTRGKFGVERLMSYVIATENSAIALLPGDDLYPEENEVEIPNTDVWEDIPQTKVMHRIFNPESLRYKVVINNYVPSVRHILPVTSSNDNDSKL